MTTQTNTMENLGKTYTKDHLAVAKIMRSTSASD